MKKLLPLFIFVVSSHVYAETINCPTAKNYMFENKEWILQVEKDTPSNDLTHNFGKDFYNYDPWLKVIDNHPTKGIYGMGFKYNSISTRAIKEAHGITLECNGTYSANICPNSWWGNCTSSTGNFKSSLPLGNEYKYCMSIDASSFDCEK